MVALIDITTNLGSVTDGQEATASGAGPIEKLVLCKAADRSEIIDLRDGAEINLSSLETTELTIVAELSASVERVRFVWSEDLIHNEGSAPYAMDGKAGSTAFKPVAYLSAPGSGKKVIVTAFGSGDAVLGTYELEFSVVEE